MINETLSAMMDGEASTAEADAQLRALAGDAQLRRSLSRQYWLRESLRSSEPVAPDIGFAERVAQALEHEAAPAVAQQQRTVVPLHARRRRASWQAWGSVAAAASIVAAVLFVGNPLHAPESDGTPVQAGTLASAPSASVSQAGAMVQPVAARSNEAAADAAHWSSTDPAVADQLNGYLLEHNGLAHSYGVSGATPGFVRVATYGEERDR